MWPRSKKVMPFFYYFAAYMTRTLFALLTRCQVEGKENVPLDGPLLVVANHMNNADPPLLSASLPREIVFMAKEELFRNRFVRIFVEGFGAFSVHRSRYDREAMRRAEEAIQKGLALGMFPEGTRSPTAQLQEGFPGATILARRLQCPILPVGITGTEKIKGFFWFLHRPVIRIFIGQTFQLPASSGQTAKIDLKEATSFIMRHIAELLPEKYHGVYKKDSSQG